MKLELINTHIEGSNQISGKLIRLTDGNCIRYFAPTHPEFNYWARKPKKAIAIMFPGEENERWLQRAVDDTNMQIAALTKTYDLGEKLYNQTAKTLAVNLWNCCNDIRAELNNSIFKDMGV